MNPRLILPAALIAPLLTAGPPPAAPAGFVDLFNGRDLTGWRGSADDDSDSSQPARGNRHWSVEEGVLRFDGKGGSLATDRDFADFELQLDWKIAPGGDSGIYLRGMPQVQIWDNPAGSGGLYNNRVHPSTPRVVADEPPGRWNSCRIVMIGERVSVWLNDINVVEDVVLENFRDRAAPLPRRGPIELQAHGSPLWFRNVRIREIPEPDSSRHLLLDDRMDWWRDARFGMFIHWGLYAIPAGRWDGRPVSGVGEWIMYHGQITAAAYEPLREQFNPVRFDADEWAQLARRAGMRYLVITTKHHDGFCLFDSMLTDYDVMDAPYRRDIMKELTDACRRAGIRIGWYHSILDWHHPDYLPRRPWDRREDVPADFSRYVNHLFGQVTELLTKYGPIDIMWFDGEWEETWTHELGRMLHDHVRRLQPDIIVNNRVDKGREGMAGLTRDRRFLGDFGTPEQQVPAQGLAGVDWESCITMNDSWGYKRDDENWKSSTALIRLLIDTASKGGNLLLNVGPMPSGEIPPASVERLEAMGRWLDRNGESIYGTSAGPFTRLDWGRCTMRPLENGSRLYLHVFDRPEGAHLRVPGLGNSPRKAYLLAKPEEPLAVDRDGGDLVIRTGPLPAHEPATVIVLDIEGDPMTPTAVPRP